MLQIAVCDDEPMITSKIEQLLEKVSAVSDTEISIDVFFDGKTLSNQVTVTFHSPLALLLKIQDFCPI